MPRKDIFFSRFSGGLQAIESLKDYFFVTGYIGSLVPRRTIFFKNLGRGHRDLSA